MQKALDSPAVKQAREAYLAAQKQYTEALQSVMGKPPTSGGQTAKTKPLVLPASTITNASGRAQTTPSPGR
jgi:hypothetical protein